MNECCGDNRFEIIAAYKRDLLDGTNIETSPEEMAAVDNILFRFWQMGWLKEKPRTNADRIRAMTDEELAVWMFNLLWSYDAISDKNRADWLDWLKEEADD